MFFPLSLVTGMTLKPSCERLVKKYRITFLNIAAVSVPVVFQGALRMLYIRRL